MIGILTAAALGASSAAGAGLVGAIGDRLSGRKADRDRYRASIKNMYTHGLTNAKKNAIADKAGAAIRGDQEGLTAEFQRDSSGRQNIESLAAMADARANALGEVRTNTEAQSQALGVKQREQKQAGLAALANAPRSDVQSIAMQAAGAGISAGAKQYINDPGSSRIHDGAHNAWAKSRAEKYSATMANQDFQHFAASNNLKVGSATLQADGTYAYTPGEQDGKAYRKYQNWLATQDAAP